MSLLQLANEVDLSPKRVASTNGGEYHSPCPSCGGRDRFIIWEVQGRYFCRQCEAKGDAIQFCRDFMGMDYRSACKKLGVQAKNSFFPRPKVPQKFVPTTAEEPSIAWQKSAEKFVEMTSNQSKQSPEALKSLQNRGFYPDSLLRFHLGWNPITRFDPLPTWGLPITLNESGRERKLWLPKGIVIPTMQNDRVIKLKIRRTEWQEGDSLPKYVEVSGSMKCPAVYGSKENKCLVLVESELDAMLVQQYAADLACSVAIGGAGKKPDLATDQLFRNASALLFALDYDAAGKASYRFWRSTYSHLRAWPIPRGKSPGDALKLGVDLRQWIVDGLKHLGFLDRETPI